MLKRAHWVLMATLRMRVWVGNYEYQRAISDHLPVNDWRKTRAIAEDTPVEVPWHKEGV